MAVSPLSVFIKLWRKAEAGQSEFLLIFLLWSIDPEYRARLPDKFEMTADACRLAELHELDAEQICWRRNIISQISSPELFSQEYSLVASEAFISSDFDSFIQISWFGHDAYRLNPTDHCLSEWILRAGADSTAIAWRQGHGITKAERRKGLTTMEIAGLLGAIICEEKPGKVNMTPVAWESAFTSA